MKLNFDKNSLEISDRKVITCVISIAPDNSSKFFPEENWNDSIVNILNSWLENMLLIWKGANNEAQFVFFDGPFSFKIVKKDFVYTIEFFQGSKQVDIFTIDFQEFGYNLVKLSKTILEETKARGWQSDDLKQLKFTLEKALPYFESNTA